MKQIANIFMLAAVAAVALCSCSKAKSIDVSEDKVVFSIAGGEKSIDVTADGSYDIEGCPEWVTAEVGESVLTISVSENGTGAVRDCVINLVGDNVSVPITITQADKCTYITVSETEVTIPKEGGRKEQGEKPHPCPSFWFNGSDWHVVVLPPCPGPGHGYSSRVW